MAVVGLGEKEVATRNVVEMVVVVFGGRRVEGLPAVVASKKVWKWVEDALYVTSSPFNQPPPQKHIESNHPSVKLSVVTNRVACY